MRLALPLLAGLLAASGFAAAEDYVVNLEGGDATASVLAVTTEGDAWCASTQCLAATLDGDAYCYGPYCASFAEYGTAYCQALVCVAGSVFGDSTAVGRYANTDANAAIALSVFGNAYSDRTRNNQNDFAISGTGDATSDTFAFSATGNASSSNGFAFGGCSDLGLCMDPA